jgi:hypothetical protein
MIFIAFRALMAFVIESSTCGTQVSFESKRTPKAIIVFLDLT